MVAFVGGREPREFAGGFVVEVALVNHYSAEAARVPVGVFGEAVGDDVRAVVERAAEARRWESVVHRERDPRAAGDARELFKIENFYARVGQAFPENQLGIGAHRRENFIFGGVLVYESRLDPEFFKRVREQVGGSAVEGSRAHYVVARFAQVHHEYGGRALAARTRYRARAALEGRHFLFENLHRGVGEARVEVPRNFEVEEPG